MFGRIAGKCRPIAQLVSLTHLNLCFCKNIKYLPNSIVNLSKLTCLTLSYCMSLVELPANIGQLASLTHLKLGSCDNIKSLPTSIANLSNLASLSLSSCDSLVELLVNIGQLTSLTLNNCDILTELPSNLGHMKSLSHLRLFNCNNIKSLPDSMTNLCNLKTLEINKCISLTHLPINLKVLHLKLIDCCPRLLPTGLINLKYLDVVVCSCSDESFANLKDPYSLQHLSISSCFRHNKYSYSKKGRSWDKLNASLYQASTSTLDENEDEETKLGVVPGESCNEDNNVVPTVEIHETVTDEQTSADPFNSISLGSIEHITTEQGDISHIYKEFHSKVSKDPIDENLQHTALCSQNQFNPLGNGRLMTNLPGAYYFGVNNQHAINDGQIGTITFENAHEIAPNFQHISLCGGNSFIGAWNNDHALELGCNNNTCQSYDADAIRQGREITPEATLELLPATNMRLVDAAENLDGIYSSRRENSNPEGESIPATHTDQNDIMTTEINEQGNGDNSYHDSENEQNQIPQNNNVKGMKGKEITLGTLQPFWSKNMTLEEAANKIGISRSTMKRRLKAMKLKWQSSKKGKQRQNAKKRKFNDKETCGSDSSQQNLANIPANSAAHTETVGECIIGTVQLTLPNHVLSNPSTVSNLTSDTMETIRDNLMETRGDIDHHQCAHEHLDGANECTLSDALQQNESSSSNFTVKATYKDDIVRFDFSLSYSIEQLKEEVANQLELEVNTFKIKYQDEDKDWVLVTRIFNLEDALNLSRSI